MRCRRVERYARDMLFVVFLALGQAPVVLDGDCPGGADDYFDLAFDVPAGTKEIEIAHASVSDQDVLDFGVYGPAGEYRGWAGGKKANAIVGELASSTSYLPGPLPPGTWTLNVGKARIRSAACGYHVEITLRTTPTLAPASDRQPYLAPPPFADKAGFYAGDFHVHSEDSGDARPGLDEISQFAIGKGLDFVVITDHNTTAQVDRLVDAQVRNPEILLVPGIEFTTYGGHATAFGATRYVDHRIGHNGRTVAAAIKDVTDQGALFSINHPALDLGDVCIGCAWIHEHPKVGSIQGVEIETGAFSQAGFLFADKSIQFWETLLDEGAHLAALGGSDDHQAGGDSKGIGSPTTLVFASQLSEQALRTGILDSRTVVKLEDGAAPMIDLQTDPPRTGDTALGVDVTISAIVTGGVGSQFRFVENGLGVDVPQDVTTDPQTFTISRTPDATGTERIRAESVDAADQHPLTVTSYVWLKAGTVDAGCGCSASSPAASSPAAASAPVWLSLLFLAITMGYRRSKPSMMHH